MFVAALVLFGFRLGAEPISVNSTFAHLRTGVDIVRNHAIPRADPYSYTAHGEPWVVQSWLPSWTYGWAERLGGLGLVVLEQAVLMAVLAWLVARLARAGTPLRTGLAASVAVGIGAGYWTPRPLLFGLICMALVVTVVERRGPLWLLVPVAWVWVNSHGSFPLALAWLGLRAVGDALDRRSLPRDVLRAAAVFGVGLLVGALNPLGPRLLSFALTVGEKRSVFRTITEWRSPDFQTPEGIFALAFIALSLFLLFRARLPWRDALPVAGFFALGLLAMRNIPVAAIVAAPALGRALRAPGPAVRLDRPVSAPSASPSRVNWYFIVVIGLAVALFGGGALTGTAVDTHEYPRAAVRYLERHRLLSAPHRLAHQDIPGGYLILKYGGRVRVFVDDRYDMYPLEVSRDYERLLRGRPDSIKILRSHRVDVVLWDRQQPLVTILRASGEWDQVFRDRDWVVLRRSG